MILSQQKINWKYVFLTFIFLFLSWELHELAHWTMGTILGYDMIMTLNQGYPSSGQYNKDWHYTIISAAGPVITITEAIIFFFILKAKKQIIFYSILFICFYMRFLATALSFRHPNDEARISKSIGLGTFTLPLLVTALLFYLVYNSSKKFGLSIKFNLLNFLLLILFSSLIILTDQFLHVRLL